MRQNGAVIRLESLLEVTALVLTWPRWPLLYPVTYHPSAGHSSYTENASGYRLEANLMCWFWLQHAPDVSPTDPNVSPPQLQEVPSLTPTLVATAEYDVLRDEGVAYPEKLRTAGTAVTHLHTADMGHNFPATPNLVGRFPQCNETLAEIAGWLRAPVAAEQELLFDGYVQGLGRCRNLLRTSHGLRRLDSGCRAHRPPCIGRNTRRPRQDCSDWLTTIRMGYGECRTFRLG
jgi:hypothetical protein